MNDHFPNAFASTHVNCNDETIFSEGMTLRDYFAAKAMQAITSDSNLFAAIGSREAVALSAYAMAGAMLAAREK